MKMYRVWNFLTQYSLLLILGAVVALVWANVDEQSYHEIIDYVLVKDSWIGQNYEVATGVYERKLTLHFLINDVLMALFFAIAGKEVWEAVILENGSLKGKKAITPLFAAVGGMAGPALIYLFGAHLLGSFDTLANGWAIPTATDIAFSYLVARVIFGSGHSAVGFLLLLAIADDAMGLVILATFYPKGEVLPVWLLLSLGSAILVFLLANWLPRRLDRGNQKRPNSTWVRKNLSFWPYLLAGCASWYAFQQAGVHPALGLLPIIPTIPHADRDFGIFSDAESHITDLLNTIEHGLKVPVEVILFLFGLANAGVAFSAMGEATWLVLAGLLFGKPVGICLLGLFAAYVLRLGLPDGMNKRDLFVVGCIAGIGFTVALFVAVVAFHGYGAQDSAKMGALLSFSAAFIAIIAAKILGVKKVEGN
jgi:NhaA family Na+:H+ antiporter